MKWEDFRQSENIEDRRGSDYADAGGGGFMGGGSSGHLGLGAMIVLGIIGYALGIDPRVLIGGAEMVSHMSPSQGYQQSAPRGQVGAPKDRMGQFVAAILAENEDVWKDVLPQQAHIRFVPAPVVLFNGQTLGLRPRAGADGAILLSRGQENLPGHLLLPRDAAKIRRRRRFRLCLCDFSRNGSSHPGPARHLPKMQAAQQNAGSKAQANAISVRIELQADCLAGVWAANANQKWQVIEPGDIEKAIRTAQAIGDDKLQEASRGYVVPDSFTHGRRRSACNGCSAACRAGKIEACNTFAQ